jgi:hypothetical protein
VKAAEKMIPKAVLLRALHEILDAARDPDGLVRKVGIPAGTDAARSFTLGWIEGIALGALGMNAPTTGWLSLRGPSDEGTGASNPDAVIVP